MKDVYRYGGVEKAHITHGRYEEIYHEQGYYEYKYYYDEYGMMVYVTYDSAAIRPMVF